MPRKVSFFIKPAPGTSPFHGLQQLFLQNRMVKNASGLSACVSSQKELGNDTHLVRLSRHEILQLQEQQGIPFLGFKGVPAVSIAPRSILVVNKDTDDPIHNDALHTISSSLRKLGLPHNIINSRSLTPGHFVGHDLVVALGGDGTLIRAAHLHTGQTPFLGVISSPASYGHYMLLPPEKLEQALNLMYQGKFELASLNRLAASINYGGETVRSCPALNEIYINEQDSANASRYMLQTNGLQEEMTDSGVLITTGTGSPANSWVNNAGGLAFSPDSALMQFVTLLSPRHLKTGGERVLTHGFAQEVQVVSGMRHNGRLSIDSSRHYNFPAGAQAQLTLSPNPLNLAVFPSIATSNLTLPKTPAAEVILPTKELDLSPEKIAEINAMPICRTTPEGVKKQILFLQISKDLVKLNIFGILKTGGKPLEKKDFSLKGVVANPRLLYPTAEINALPSGLRDIILNLYTYGRRVYDYNGIISEWVASIDENVWGASIDTIVFIYTLLANNILGPGVRSIGELGTGGGMIIKAGIQFCPDLVTAYASDIVQEALNCMIRNVSPVQRGVQLISIKGKGIGAFGKVDVLKVNPPYLPEKKVTGEVDQYRGLGLIHEVLRDGKEHLNPGGKVIINYSSCAGKEFDGWVKQYGWKKRVLFTIDVPLKINRVNEDQEWLDFMLEHGGLEVRDDNQFGYKYWHKLNVVELIPE